MFRQINNKTFELFHSYAWPGNIREIQNVVERSVILTQCDLLSVNSADRCAHSSLPSKELYLRPPRGASSLLKLKSVGAVAVMGRAPRLKVKSWIAHWKN